jgi:hypothetical protein
MKVAVAVAALLMGVTALAAGPGSAPAQAEAPYFDAGAREGSVYRLYRAYFLREPEAAGFMYWYVVAVGGRSLDQVSESFAQSPEFRSRYGAVDDARFVDLVYRNVLGRSPDATGLRYWLGRMATGTRRGTVMIAFSDSGEFRRLTATSVPPGWRAGSNALALLNTLAVAAEPTRVGYSRSLFPSWDDEDHDGCNTRCEVLAAERRPDGTWFSLWDGYVTPNSNELEIDHVVALAEAWDSGANRWSAEQRDRFADWTVNLTAVTSATNVSKSDRDAASWFPSRAASNCAFAEITVTTKSYWRLSVDPAEKSALTNLLRTCTGRTTKPPAPTPTTRPPTTRPPTTVPPAGCSTAGIYGARNGACVGSYVDGSGDVDCGQLPAAMKPVAVFNPANDPYGLDGNHDGVGCEAG